MSPLAPTLQSFLTERLLNQRQASPATITSYRHTFELLLRFVRDRTGKLPSTLDWDDRNVEMISAFLAQQKNSIPITRHLFHGDWNYTITPRVNKLIYSGS